MAAGFGTTVDMSLDDIVQKNKKIIRLKMRRGGLKNGVKKSQMRLRGKGGMKKNFRVGKNSKRQLPDIWDKGSLLAKGNSALSKSASNLVISSTRLIVSNLNFGVTNEDIKELFGTCGKLKKAVINYDNTGHSNGTAEIIFFDKASAQKAVNSYNGMCLDQRPLKIQYLDAPDATKTSAISRLSLPQQRGPMKEKGRLLNRKIGQGNRNTRGRAKAKGRVFRKTPKTQEQLDRELLNYQNVE